MAGEITLSEKPGEALKKWRLNFDIAQTELSSYLGVSPSVISDYESGRRKSPGTLIVSKIIEALLSIETEKGGKKIHAYESMLYAESPSKAVYGAYEYTYPMQLARLSNLIDGTIIYKGIEKPLYGFTVIDSKRAILEMSSHEFQRLYGWSTERAMIFTKVSTGKSPMVAIRVTSLKPATVVIHGIQANDVDPMVKKMAEVDRIPVIATTMDLDELIATLKKYSQYHALE